MSPKHQRHYWSSSGQKPFKISLTGRLGTATFHWHILFKRNPLHLQLHHPSLWANLIQSNMDPLSPSSLHEHHTLKLYFMTTIPTSITSLRKQHEVLHMLPLSSLSNKPRMEEEHGVPLPASMLEMTSGKLRSRNKNSCCIPEYGKARATSCLSTSSPNITMHTYQCWHVLNMSNTYCQMNTHELVSCLMQFNVTMLDYRPQWPVLKLIMA